jgi:hypothetical protein
MVYPVLNIRRGFEMKLQNITALQWIGIIILFNTTLLGGASQLGDLSLSPGVVKAILAVATLGNGFLGGLVTMFGGLQAQKGHGWRFGCHRRHQPGQRRRAAE